MVRINEIDVKETDKKIRSLRVIELQILIKAFSLGSPNCRKSELQEKALNYFKSSALTEERKHLFISKVNSLYKSVPFTKIMEAPQTDVVPQAEIVPKLKVHIPLTIPIQPDVKFKKLTFYEHLGVLLPPTSLIPSNLKQNQMKFFYYHLTPHQIGLIMEQNIQVQIRFCLLETSSEQEDNFPQGLHVKVNNKVVQLPTPLPARPGSIPKLPPKPLNVTLYTKTNPTGTNEIQVYWHQQPHKNFAVTCNLVRKITPDELLQKMKQKGIKNEDFTRALIKEKLNEDKDSEIATTMLRVSLLCPLGKLRMKIPCRATTCNHLQCFDALLYLQMNECKPTWICPVCSTKILYENLFIDGYFLEVIKSLDPNTDEIQLHKDGSWTKHEMDTKEMKSLNVSSETVEISDDEDEIIFDHNNNGVKRFKNDYGALPVHHPVMGLTNVSQISRPVIVAIKRCVIPKKALTGTVDLTLEDDDN